MNIKHTAFAFFSFSMLASSCSLEKQIQREASKYFTNDSLLSRAHVGIAIQDLEKKNGCTNFNLTNYLPLRAILKLSAAMPL